MLKQRVEQELKDKELLTPSMRLIEIQFGRPIRELITPHKGMPSSNLAEILGIDEGTLSKWRKRLGFTEVRMIKPGPKRKD